jgi:hypothetical protein
MSAKNNTVPPEIYQLKVTLLGTSPPIWRRLLVPADVTLAQLHDVLQAAMGWLECHMHEFSAGGRHFGRPNPEDRFMGMPPVENERTVRLSRVLGRVGITHIAFRMQFLAHRSKSTSFYNVVTSGTLAHASLPARRRSTGGTQSGGCTSRWLD